MKTLIIIGIILAVYLLSVWSMRCYFSKAYSKDGIWSSLSPGFTDFLTVYFPCVNTFGGLLSWMDQSPTKEHKKDYTKFFDIKK